MKHQMAKSLDKVQILLWVKCFYITVDDKNTHNHSQGDSDFFEPKTPLSHKKLPALSKNYEET